MVRDPTINIFIMSVIDITTTYMAVVAPFVFVLRRLISVAVLPLNDYTFCGINANYDIDKRQ